MWITAVNTISWVWLKTTVNESTEFADNEMFSVFEPHFSINISVTREFTSQPAHTYA